MTVSNSKESNAQGIMTATGDALVVGPSGSGNAGSLEVGQVDLNYVANKNSVMKIFSMPYSDKSVSVGIHNVEGCLIIDADPTLSETYENDDTAVREKIVRNSTIEEKGMDHDPSVALALQRSAALSTISSMIEKKRSEDEDESGAKMTDSQQTSRLLLQESNLAVETIENTSSEQYLPWEFAGMKMLVRSNALVYRSTPETSLTVRVEDAEVMRQQLKNHNNFLAQHRLTNEQKQTQEKRSYAEALQSRQLIVRPENEKTRNTEIQKALINKMPPKLDRQLSGAAMSSAEEIPGFTLQTTMVPSTSLPLGGKFSVSSEPPPASDSLSLPICTVIDAYLDQLINCVPQLALVLREKGFVQSVKLLQTETIPSAFMQERTFDTSRPFEVINLQAESPQSSEQIFDVNLMKMNAASLLNFLRANCTKDNATYLLHREAGQTNIQLLDVTAISSQRQRKWIWWLAMMSYRFAQRLRNLSMHLSAAPRKTEDAALRRSFRARERSLLQNTLSLLEEFGDMGGSTSEILVAEVCEKLADTFLRAHAEDDSSSATTTMDSEPASASHKPVPATSTASAQQRFGHVKPDALSKAQDHLEKGIGVLRKCWSEVVDSIEKQSAGEGGRRYTSKGVEETKFDDSNRVISIDADESSSDSENEEETNMRETEALEVKAETLGFHLLSLHDKTVDIHLRLAEHHLNEYFSSSAMQALRNSARRIADAVKLFQAPSTKSKKSNSMHLKRWRLNLQIQFTRLWELCGHFARSFAADDLWRERGHAAGDDVVGVLRDVQSAISWQPKQGSSEQCFAKKAPSVEDIFFPFHQGLSEKAWDLYDLSGIPSTDETLAKEAIEAAKRVLEGKRQLSRDRRRVLVAASVSYNRAVSAYGACMKFQRGGATLLTKFETPGDKPESNSESDKFTLNLLRQRQGDANNELGKLLLQELRTFLAGSQNASLAAEPLLSSAQFWFQEGLGAFESSSDIRNSTLLRCNLCQCYKLRANSNFATGGSSHKKGNSGASERSAHADACLKEAISHLQAAHERIGQRDVDPATWDMVSNELAATNLLLGVRRRQALLGGGNAPALLHLLRLSPGEARSIIGPMEKALVIYEQSGNIHQAAAVNYQLALFYSKVWTCQRDEAKTREKLSAAFRHFNAAHAFFAASVRGNETTFVLLCLDLSNLYSTVSGEECLCQALLRCLDTLDAFSRDAIDQCGTGVLRSEWLETMSTLATSVEDRLFRTLRSLAKTEEETKDDKSSKFKNVYRAALGAKMVATQAAQSDEANTNDEKTLLGLHTILRAVKESYAFSLQ